MDSYFCFREYKRVFSIFEVAEVVRAGVRVGLGLRSEPADDRRGSGGVRVLSWTCNS